jgi:hypothetical protein
MDDDERPRFNHLTDHLKKRSANCEWILAALSTFTADGHPFIHRSYGPECLERHKPKMKQRWLFQQPAVKDH